MVSGVPVSAAKRALPRASDRLSRINHLGWPACPGRSRQKAAFEYDGALDFEGRN